MNRDLTALIKPQTIAVIGASATKEAQGNLVIDNLLSRGFQGRIIPVHRQAASIQGLPTVPSIEALPEGVDLVVASVPARAAAQTTLDLEGQQVKSAIFFAAGFSKDDKETFRTVANGVRMNVLGPNCMGLINCSDATFLYPAKTSARLKTGKVALLAQSGSAAITVMNSADFGFSKIITVGSEFQLSAADYMHWLAEDDETSTVGIVMESIQDPVSFAKAVQRLYASGKSLAVLKVGQSQIGAAATTAHTGAMTRDADTYDLYFRRHGITAVRDYDELAATLQCLDAWGHKQTGNGVAIAGISGGQTALACDVAEDVGVELTKFTPQTEATLQNALPGTPGLNPVDFGAVVDKSTRDSVSAIGSILDDSGTGVLAFVQDCQKELNERSLGVYLEVVQNYCLAVARSDKPVVAISPTSGEVHETLRAEFATEGIPLVRGLREGLVAIKALAMSAPADAHNPDAAVQAQPETLAALRIELKRQSGQVDRELALRLLSAYGIPVAKSCIAKDAASALDVADTIGFPMVVKIASPDIAHRSELGGVVLNVRDKQELENVITSMHAKITCAAPQACIEGFELQTHFSGDLEAMVGAVASPPFGSKIIVGSGGTLVEILKDTAQGLAPISLQTAAQMIKGLTIGVRMDGYRNLLPKTDIQPLGILVQKISSLMEDFGDLITACDLNPVIIRKVTGELMVVDILMEASGKDQVS